MNISQIISKLELVEKNIQNLKTKKNLRLVVSHIKLLYKYRTALNSTTELSFQNTSFHNNPRGISELSIISDFLGLILPEYKDTLKSEMSYLFNGGLYGSEINLYLEHFLDLLEISLTGEEAIESGNIFLGIDEKLQRANTSAREGNAEGTFSSLHTVIELLFKDKLGIALDMDGARLGKVLRICITNEVFNGKNNILERLNKNVCEIDNKIKHSGYNPTAKEINDALLVSTQAVRVLKKEIPNIDNTVTEEISQILIKNN